MHEQPDEGGRKIPFEPDNETNACRPPCGGLGAARFLIRLRRTVLMDTALMGARTMFPALSAPRTLSVDEE
ncbi:MAG: hypothetical protein ACYTHJ_06265 [Planctomycetota bacterium]|jgi:hypothetical protein